MGEKHRMTHTQTFFPESLILNILGRSPGLRLVVDLPIQSLNLKIRSKKGKTSILHFLSSYMQNSGCVDNNKLSSLQLRVQLRI